MCVQRGDIVVGRYDGRSKGMDWDMGSWLLILRGGAYGDNEMDSLVGHGAGSMVYGVILGM